MQQSEEARMAGLSPLARVTLAHLTDDNARLLERHSGIAANGEANGLTVPAITKLKCDRACGSYAYTQPVTICDLSCAAVWLSIDASKFGITKGHGSVSCTH